MYKIIIIYTKNINRFYLSAATAVYLVLPLRRSGFFISFITQRLNGDLLIL